jgi:hypothetical protein
VPSWIAWIPWAPKGSHGVPYGSLGSLKSLGSLGGPLGVPWIPWHLGSLEDPLDALGPWGGHQEESMANGYIVKFVEISMLAHTEIEIVYRYLTKDPFLHKLQ